jgi:two-component sensor histidine kinase
MAAIEGELWLGVETGALVLDLETLEAKAFIPMSCDFCQPKDFVYDPRRNRIWAASSNGIWEIDARNHRLLRMVTQENGLRGNTGFSPQCITLDSEGTIYYATSTGLAAYRPELARPQTDSFSVYVRARQFQHDHWGKHEVALSVAALDYREEKKVYQTKLEGYDEDWSETTKNATLRYTNLPAYLFPKTYQFRIRSLTDDGEWIENAVPAEITASPPWYFRWWAALIGLGLLALAIRQYLRFQLRRQTEALALKKAAVIKKQRDEIKQKNDQNELLLKEIHHRVKNNLEVVSSLLELQSAGLSDSEARDAMKAGQSRVQSMGLLHQKLYQGENLAAIEMKDYFHNLAGSLLETYEAEDRIKVNVVMDPLELDVDTAVPLGLIVNELLTNAIKYAFEGGAAGAVEVGLSKEGAGCLLKVTDNGVGKDLDVPATGTGFGTRLVNLLARQLGGTLTEVNEGGLKTELQFGDPA